MLSHRQTKMNFCVFLLFPQKGKCLMYILSSLRRKKGIILKLNLISFLLQNILLANYLFCRHPFHVRKFRIKTMAAKQLAS